MTAINLSTKMSGGARETLTSSIGDSETQLTLNKPCKGSCEQLTELTYIILNWSWKFMNDKDTSDKKVSNREPKILCLVIIQFNFGVWTKNDSFAKLN